MPRLKKVATARTVADVDAGLMAVAAEYKKQYATKTAEIDRLNALVSELYTEQHELRMRIEAVDLAVGSKVFNANL